MNLLLKFLIILSFLFTILLSLPKYTSKFNYESTKNDFNNSPYVLGNNYKTIIQDEDFYALHGYMYLNGIDFDKTIYDHPPFGKFIIGLSIFLTGNQNIIQIFVSSFSLIAFYFLSKEVLKNITLSLVSVLILSLEPLFREQVSTSLLDQNLMLFLTLSLLFTIKSLKNNKWIILSLFSLGLFSSIKFPANSIILITSIMMFYLLIRRLDLLKSFLKYLFIVPAVYFILYFPFIEGGAKKFIDLQIFAVKWHKSHLPNYPKGEILRLLTFNSWRTWWGDKPFVTVPYFHLGWPISGLSFVVILISSVIKKLDPEIYLIIIWSLFYLIGSSIRVVFPRYLLLVLPFLYINLIYLMKYAYRFGRERSQYKRKSRQ